MVLAQTTSQWIDFRFFDLRLRLLDSDHHGSLFGVISIVAELLAAATMGMRAASTRRLGWLCLAAVVGLLSVPRALMRYVPAFERYDVAILLAPLTITFVALCALTFRDAPRVRVVVWTSLLLLASSFALHAVGPQADGNGNTGHFAARTWSYQAAGMVKHGAELAGWMLLATALAVAVASPTKDTRGARGAQVRRCMPF